MPVMNRRAALNDAYGTGKYGGMISSYGGPQMQTSLGGMQGEGLLDWLKKAHSFVKDNKLISRGARALDRAGLPFLGTVGNVAETLGHGKKPRKKRQSGGNSYGINGGKKKGTDTSTFQDLFNDYQSLDIAEVDTLTVVDQLTILAPTNQIVFGDVPNQVTLNVNTGSNSTINIPTIAPSLVADVVLTETDQDINGNKRFNDTTTTNTLLSTDLTSINGTITTLNSTNATINNLSSQTINATTPLLIVPSISVSNITANTGNIDTLTTVTTNANTVNAGTLTATTLSSPSGNINNLASQTINATTSFTTPTTYTRYIEPSTSNIIDINNTLTNGTTRVKYLQAYHIDATGSGGIITDGLIANNNIQCNRFFIPSGATENYFTFVVNGTILPNGANSYAEINGDLKVDGTILPTGANTYTEISSDLKVDGSVLPLKFKNATASYVPTALDYYEVQTYSVTWSFGTPTSTKTVKVVRTGSLVVITYEGPQFTIGGTSGGWNATTPNFLPARFMPTFDSGVHNLQSGYYNSGTAPFRFQCRSYLTTTGGLIINSTSGGSVSANAGATVRFDPGSIVYCL